MMSILLSILIPAPAQGGIDTTPPPPLPPSNLLILAGIGAPPPPPPQGLIYQAKRHRSHPNTYFALKQRKLQLENSSFRDHLWDFSISNSTLSGLSWCMDKGNAQGLQETFHICLPGPKISHKFTGFEASEAFECILGSFPCYRFLCFLCQCINACIYICKKYIHLYRKNSTNTSKTCFCNFPFPCHRITIYLLP